MQASVDISTKFLISSLASGGPPPECIQFHISKFWPNFRETFEKILKPLKNPNIFMKIIKNWKFLPKNCNFFIGVLKFFENFSCSGGSAAPPHSAIPYIKTPFTSNYYLNFARKYKSLKYFWHFKDVLEISANIILGLIEWLKLYKSLSSN